MDDEFIYPLNRHLTPYYESQDKDTVKLYHGNCIDVLKKMSGNSVQCCVTSPPYWGLRDYGTNSDDEIGSERTVDEYVAKMVQVFREVKRVLTNDGTLWLNLGDTYSNPGSTNRNGKSSKTLDGGNSERLDCRKANYNIKQAGTEFTSGNLVGVPWRVAFALQQDGWVLRQDIIWHKPNPMPESVTNRCTKAHEYIFLLTKSMDYYYDNESIKDPLKMSNEEYAKMLKYKERQKSSKMGTSLEAGAGRKDDGFNSFISDGKTKTYVPEGANKRSVWSINSQAYPEAHFATFPRKLIEPCILAGSRENDIVLDPFMGAATTAITAIGNKRRTWGIELNEEYINLQIKRIEEYTLRNTNVWQYMNRHIIKGK